MSDVGEAVREILLTDPAVAVTVGRSVFSDFPPQGRPLSRCFLLGCR